MYEILICLGLIILIPYSYILTRGISKAWHKSKEEEKPK